MEPEHSLSLALSLDRAEYIEQAHFFESLRQRLEENEPLQSLLGLLRHEVLATTKLPLAIDFLMSELRHAGVIGTAMEKLSHYFTPFQTYLICEAERDRGRFDMRVALKILASEAKYRSKSPTLPGLFVFQFEVLCRNRLRYDAGLTAISTDPAFGEIWRKWIVSVRRQIGIIDFADMVYVRSAHYKPLAGSDSEPLAEEDVLFGEMEGRIALANRKKDPLFLFSSLQRQLGYPEVPRVQPPDESVQILPTLLRRVERLEQQVKLLKDEQQGGIDLSQFYKRPDDLAQ